MKKRLTTGLGMALGLCFVLCGKASAQQYGQKVDTLAYGIDRRHVYYAGKIVPDADASSFRYLGFGYGKDRRWVFYKGKRMYEVDAETFRVLSSESPEVHFPADRPRTPIYQETLPIEALPGTWLGWGYSKSTFDVFFQGRKMADATASSFKVLDYGYAKDSFEVFYFGQKIEDATSSSFKTLPDGYAKDSFNAYFEGRKIEDASSSSFEYVGNGVAKDRFNKYYLGRKVEELW